MHRADLAPQVFQVITLKNELSLAFQSFKMSLKKAKSHTYVSLQRLLL